MYDFRSNDSSQRSLRLSRSDGRQVAPATGPIPRLATRRDLIRGAVLGGAGLALGGYARLARAGAWPNLGSAPAIIGDLYGPAVQANFNGLINSYAHNIPRANLNLQEVSLLASRFPGDLSAYFPTGSAAHSKYVQTREFLPCPPTLGCLGGLDSTMTEIYLDFRLFGGAPAGGIYAPLSLSAATLATAIYYGGLALFAYGAGYQAGSYLVGWMQKYDTTSWDQIVSLVGGTANAVSWFGSGIQSMAVGAYDYGTNLFGKDSWNFNNQFFGLSPYTLGIGGPYGYGNSIGWGVFDSIDALDVDPSGGGCISPDGC